MCIVHCDVKLLHGEVILNGRSRIVVGSRHGAKYFEEYLGTEWVECEHLKFAMGSYLNKYEYIGLVKYIYD